MPDLDEAVWQDVEKETPDELQGVEPHDFALIAVRGVAIPKLYKSIFQIDQAVIRDRDSVRIAPEVGDNVISACKGFLAVNSPLFGVEISGR
jgi:hypothetical protein